MTPPLAQYTWSIPGLLADACAAAAIVCAALLIAELRGIVAEVRAERDAEATQHDGGDI